MASGTTGQGDPAGLDTLEQFESLIVRASRRASRYITGSDIMAEDLAQDVRFRLARALEGAVLDEPMVRTVITSALRDRIRYERSRIQLASNNMVELDDRNFAFSLTDSSTRTEILTVARWVASLPSRLQSVFELIYEAGYTQREASSLLGLSQPRITQLHQELLKRGRLDLAILA